MPIRFGVPIALALLSFGPCAFGQGDNITRVTVNEIRIDATVTDADGKTVRDLRESDFQVFQDGKRQTPIHVQFIARSEPAKLNGPLKRSDVERTTVILLDDANMSFETFSHSRAAIKQYLDSIMHPGDLVAILRTTQTNSYLNPFVSDPTALRLTVDQMRYSFPLASQAGLPATWYPLLRSTLSAMRRMPGKKSVILFCDAFPLSTSPLDYLNSVADSALRSAVRIYAIDSRGLTSQKAIPVTAYSEMGPDPLRNNSPMAQAARAALQPADVDFPPHAYADLVPDTTVAPGQATPRLGDQEGVAFLARQTGGLMLQENNNLGAELQRALDDQSGYYLISWNPGEKAFKPAKGSFADYHRVAVHLNRAGLSARFPQGFYGFDGGGNPDPVRSPRIVMQEALLSPFHTGSLDARMNSQFDIEEGRAYIRSFVYINGKDIDFSRHLHPPRIDCYTLKLEFLTLPQPIDSQAETLAESQLTNLEMCGPTYDEISHNGLAVTMLHPIDKPGGYQMRMAVRNTGDYDTISLPDPRQPKRLQLRLESVQSVGSMQQLVIVPDWHREPAVFGLRVQREKIAASVVRPRATGETEKNMTLAYRPAFAGDPSLRHFHPGEQLLYEAQIVNVTEASAEIAIMRSDSETALYKGAAVVQAGVVSGAYPIGRDLPPGHYYLQLTATGNSPDGPYRGTAEIDFELQN